MIIGLCGYAQSGKDSVAKTLVEKYGFTRVAFADKIRDLLYEMNPSINSEYEGVSTSLKKMVDAVGWDEAKCEPEVRRLLQTLGVGARTVFYEEFWIDVALTNVTNYKDSKNFVITDVRFKNEVAALRNPALGGTIWRIERPGVTAVNTHVSEHDLIDLHPDYTVLNDTTLENLDTKVVDIMRAISAN